jgi:hypothetical protein
VPVIAVPECEPLNVSTSVSAVPNDVVWVNVNSAGPPVTGCRGTVRFTVVPGKHVPVTPVSFCADCSPTVPVAWSAFKSIVIVPVIARVLVHEPGMPSGVV